jgi:hypothetical protein
MDLLTVTYLPSPMMNVPTESKTTCPDEQLLTAVWMFDVSSPPLGFTVAQTVVRFGIPPTDWSPAIFQLAEASRSEGKRPLVGSGPVVPVVPLEPVVPEASLSEHETVAPPWLPAQVHDHGPAPVTVDAVPALQRFAVGALLTVPPFALPQAPAVSSRAEQPAVVPPPEPAQVQVQGPLPLTLDAVPALQRFAVGLLVRSAAFEEPHAPLTAVVPVEPPLEVVVPLSVP